MSKPVHKPRTILRKSLKPEVVATQDFMPYPAAKGSIETVGGSVLPISFSSLSDLCEAGYVRDVTPRNQLNAEQYRRQIELGLMHVLDLTEAELNEHIQVTVAGTIWPDLFSKIEPLTDEGSMRLRIALEDAEKVKLTKLIAENS